MLQYQPLNGSFPISRPFGANPELYAGITYADVPMLGHNGIDFLAPIETAVLAVQNGTVLEVRDETVGFGKSILLAHEWGQTLYAHLSHSYVQANQTVSAGQLIALSGESGLAAGPHFHFGMRIKPYDLQDGWFGYSDPAPYLKRILRAQGPIIGPHIVGSVPFDLLARWQPRLIVVVDPNPNEMARLRQTCPGSVIIGRIFETDHVIAERIRNDPQDAAQWAHDKTLERMTPHVDYWQFANEILQDAASLPLLNEFELARMALAEQAGYLCAIFAFSVGNPDLPEADRMALWRLVYPAIEHAEQQEHIIAVHQYGTPDLWGPEADLSHWLINRLEHQVLRRLPYKKVKFAVTEYGIDGMINQADPAGWQVLSDTNRYVNQLLENGTYLEYFSGRVLGYAVFTLGHNPPWSSYDIAGQVAEELAARSPRGRWMDMQVSMGNVPVPESDFTIHPGTDDPSVAIHSPFIIPEEPRTEIDEDLSGPDIETGNPDPPSEPIPEIERRLSDSYAFLNFQIHELDARPDRPLDGLGSDDIVYLIKDVFTTYNGSWELAENVYSVPAWARESYLRPFGASDWFDDAGADHHLFGAVIGLDGVLIPNQEIIYWSDGFTQLDNPDYQGYSSQLTKTTSGWCNLPISNGSSFVPDRGESGPWCWMPAGPAEVFCGGGLPSNHHVSTFVVWQAVRLGTLTGTPDQDENSGENSGPTDPVTPPVTPPITEPPAPETSGFNRRATQWATDLGITVRNINERPDQPLGDIVYVVKDIFTTRDGSWEPSDRLGSIEPWAREYLRPFGAPDYFDDAGGDRHIFAAVRGLDGQLMRHKEILFWSDGFQQLGNSGYNEYVRRETKSGSGWINIPIGPGSSFVPERGETGPWCWAPAGAAQVVCGGGLPANQHVSFFVVWQAMRRDDLTRIEGEVTIRPPMENDSEYHTYFPIIGANSSRPGPEVIAARSLPQSNPKQIDFAALLEVRGAAWQARQLSFKAHSPLAQYARLHSLGMPVTDEFEAGNYLAQGFLNGVVYMRIDTPNDVGHMAW